MVRALEIHRSQAGPSGVADTYQVFIGLKSFLQSCSEIMYGEQLSKSTVRRQLGAAWKYHTANLVYRP